MVKSSVKDLYRKFCCFLLRRIIPYDVFKDFKPSDEQSPYSELEKKVQNSDRVTQALSNLLNERSKQCEELESKCGDLERTLDETKKKFKYEHEQWSLVNRMQKHTIVQFQKEMFDIIRPVLKGWHSQRGELYDLVLILDLEKKIAVANPKVLEHLGYSYQEILGKESFTDIIYFKDAREKVMKGDYSFEEGIDLVNKEGNLTHLKTHMRYVPSPEQPLFTFVFLRKEGRFESRRHRIPTSLYSGEARDGYRELVVPDTKDRGLTKALYHELDKIKNGTIDTKLKPDHPKPKVEINLENIRAVPKKLGTNLATMCILLGSNLRITNAHKSDEVYNDLIQRYNVQKENIYTRD